MKLFIIHAGFYDNEIGMYELHTNFLAVGKDVNEIKKIIKEKELFKKKNMHIDAIQEIETIDGYKINLVTDNTSETKVNTYDYSIVKKIS